MIKNLIFDLGGVIVPLNRIACLRAFDEVVGYKDFGEVLNSYRQIGFFEKFENGEISANKFRQIIRINGVCQHDRKMAGFLPRLHRGGEPQCICVHP